MLVKIVNPVSILRNLSLIFLFFFCSPLHSQDLKVVSTARAYRKQCTDDSLLKMVELKKIMPGLRYDLRYATRNNFTGEVLYSQGKKTFMRTLPAAALFRVEQELKHMGYGLKIFDAYRPYSATVKMWELIQDERYVANPAKGSGHNRGLAVDLTIINRLTGEELEMGTGFDNFTDTAHRDFKGLPDSVLKNRKLLRTLMEKQGFTALETEWWHYYWPNNRKYDVLNLDFKHL